MSSSSCESDVISPVRAHSSPFSISDILSKDIGQKRSPTNTCPIPHTSAITTAATTPGSSGDGASKAPPYSIFAQENANQIKHGSMDTPKRPKKTSTSHFMARNPKIALSEAGNIVSSGAPTFTGYGERQVLPMVTPRKKSSQMNTSLVSPFNANFLAALGHRPSPNREEKEELFGDNSLEVLSEAAQYHGELSGAKANSTLDAPSMQEQFANIRLVTSSDYSDGPLEASKGGARDASLITPRARKTSTPGILKRDKKRRRERVVSVPASGEDSVNRQALNSAFLSPLSTEKSTTAAAASSKDLTFSPSIFLSRPDHTDDSMGSSPDSAHHHRSTTSYSPPDPTHSHAHSHSPSSSLHHHHHPSASVARPEVAVTVAMATTSSSLSSSSLGGRLSMSPGSESDGGAAAATHNSLSDDGGGGAGFVTSTPKSSNSGKENLVQSQRSEAWSPTILLSKRRRLLKEPNEADGDHDGVKKPCFHGPHRRKSKARTKLSPLLENACSPISKDSAPHPSPLAATTQVVTAPTTAAKASEGPVAAAAVACNSNSSSSNRPQYLPMSATSSLPVVSIPQQQQQQQQPVAPSLPPTAFLGVGAAGAASLLAASPSPMVLGRPFPAASALLPLSTPQMTTQAHQNLLLQQNSLSQLQAAAAAAVVTSPFTYNSLASMCNTSALQGFIPNTAGGMPSYFPGLVGLMAQQQHQQHQQHQQQQQQQQHPASYLSYNNPYAPPDVRMLSMNSSGNSSGSSCSSGSDSSGFSYKGVVGNNRDTKHLRSVPPWFIFSNNRSEKRSRLTEAINKSLSEASSPSATKLPLEWTKLACGQTNDQKHMTEEARTFLQLRTRQLTLNSSNSSSTNDA